MRYYTDDEIRGMLIERKRVAKRKAAIKETIVDIIGCLMLFGGIYIFAMLGCAAGIN